MKKQKHFPDKKSLQGVINVVNDAAIALDNPGRTAKDSPIAEVLSAALGATAGGAVTFCGLYALGVSGLSAAGITSALAAVGGSMVGGVFVCAAPILGLAAIGVAIGRHISEGKLEEAKRELLKTVTATKSEVHKAIRPFMNGDRKQYLRSLEAALALAEHDLLEDLDDD